MTLTSHAYFSHLLLAKPYFSFTPTAQSLIKGERLHYIEKASCCVRLPTSADRFSKAA